MNERGADCASMDGWQELDRAARELRDACFNIGFFYVKNHGVCVNALFSFLSFF